MNRSSNIHTTETPLDPKVAAELAALDAALRGEAIEDDVLATLVRDVQAQAPTMPAQLREQLRDDVAAGFPRGGVAGAFQKLRGGGAQRKSPRPRRSFAFGSGIAVAAICVVFVAGVALERGRDDATTAVTSTVARAPEAINDPMGEAEPRSPATTTKSKKIERQTDAVDLASGAAGAGVVERLSASPSGGEGAAKAVPENFARDAAGDTFTNRLAPSAEPPTATSASGKRRVEQSVDLSVRVKSGKLDEASGKVGDITRQAGGYVADSQVSFGTRGAGSASFTLQVASSKLDLAIGRLSDLGTVTMQNQSSTDITSSFDSANQRLNDAKAVRKALLRSLDKADTAGEIASLRARIADNRGTISSLESAILKLNRRTNLVTIALALTAPSGDAPEGDDDGQWSIGDAAGDALDILGAVSGVLLVAAAALLPFALIGAIAWVLYRVRRRRQRDAALDG